MELQAKARGGKLYAQGTIGGVRVRKSLDLEVGASRAVIRRKLEDVELETKRKLASGGSKAVRVEEVCRAYLGRPDGIGASTALYVERFMDRYGKIEVEALKPYDVYCSVKDTGNKSGSIRRELGAIETAMNWGKDAGMFELDKPFSFKKPTPDPARTRYMTPDEVEKVLKAATPAFKPLVLFLIYTGARLGEALKTTWKDITKDETGWRVRLVSRKGRAKKEKVRWIDLHPVVVKELEKLAWKEGKLFRPSTGEESPWRNWVYDTWREMCKQAGVEDLNPHDARRTFASNLLNMGVDIRTIADLIGDSTLNMLMIYAQAWGARKTAAVMALPTFGGVSSHNVSQ